MMNDSYFAGGAQMPLTRSYLRAAVICDRHPQAIVECTFNDSDAAGTRLVNDAKVVATLTREKGKREWLPISWKFPFSNRPNQYLALEGPAGLTIGGIPFSPEVKGVLASVLMIEIEAVKQIITSKRFELFHDGNFVSKVLERSEALESFVKEKMNMAVSIMDFWSMIGSFMLGEMFAKMKHISMTEHFSFSKDTCNNERFSMLNRFIESPTLNMDIYAELQKCEHESLPFFVVFPNSAGFLVREKLLWKQNAFWVGNQHVGDVNTIRDVNSLLKGISSSGINSVSIVPKLLPLIVYFRSISTHYASSPEYLDTVNEFARRMNEKQSPVALVKFDMARVLPRPIWKALSNFLRDEFHEYPERTFDSALNHWRSNTTIVFLWLMGGREFIDSTTQTAQLLWKK